MQELSMGTSSVSAATRERLVEKHRYINVDHDQWYDCVYEYFTERMNGVGIAVRKMFFSGFSSQGDGACFEGSLANALTYLDHHHKDQFPVIRRLLACGSSLYAECSHSGRYYHEFSTSFWVDSDTFSGTVYSPSDFHDKMYLQLDAALADELGAFEVAITAQWREYMGELYHELNQEYDSLTDDEAVWDTLMANDMVEGDEDEL